MYEQSGIKVLAQGEEMRVFYMIESILHLNPDVVDCAIKVQGTESLLV